MAHQQVDALGLHQVYGLTREFNCRELKAKDRKLLFFGKFLTI
jgi:hypothetical protein